MALHQDEEALVVCNGYKDEEYIRHRAARLQARPTVVIVVEKPTEIDHIHRVAERPRRQARRSASAPACRRAAPASGSSPAATAPSSACPPRRWSRRSTSCATGASSTACSCSTSTSARRSPTSASIKNALREAGRFYVELYKLGCTGLKYLDVGGGLGRRLRRLADQLPVVDELLGAGVRQRRRLRDRSRSARRPAWPPPDLVSESGRAVSAHHSVLIVNVLGSAPPPTPRCRRRCPARSTPWSVNLHETFHARSPKNLLESYHDAVAVQGAGAAAVQPRPPVARGAGAVRADLFWAIVDQDPRLPARREGRARGPRAASSRTSATPTSATSPCSSRCPITGRSTSCSRSCRSTAWPRSPAGAACWPTSPATPTARSTASSTRATSRRCSSCTRWRTADPYYLGIFLVGAYQEILGDLHNLFGDTNTVHVSLDENGRYTIEEVFAGDTVTDVLQLRELLRRASS